MKKFFTFFVFAMLVAALCGCNKTPPAAIRELTKPVSAYSNRSSLLTFEEAVSAATDILVADFTAFHEADDYYELEFTVTKVLRGETTEKVIYVMTVPSEVHVEESPERSFVSGLYNYVPGHSYLLVLDRRVSVYYEHDRYTMVGDIFVPLDDDLGVYMYYQPIEDVVAAETGTQSVSARGLTQDKVYDTVAALSKITSSTVPYYGTSPVQPDTVEELTACSDYVLRVSVGDLIADGTYQDTKTYECKILELLKGEFTAEETREWNQKIYVVFRTEDATPNGEYLLFLERADENSRVFCYTSVNSVHSASDPAEMQAVYDALASN